MIGVNDICHNIPNDVILENYKKILSLIENEGIKVIVQSVLLSDNVRLNKTIE